MPYPIVAPPISDYGAWTWPRELQRWLDVNRVTKLTRINTYITLPVFTQSSNTWDGYSDIVESFNFEGSNNISLVGIAGDIPKNPNYTLCVSYQINGTVTRYTLWQANGFDAGQVFPQYTNQLILKNFRLEVWNTSQGVASQTGPIKFYTSKLGGIDYRWGTDTTLVNSDTPVTNFSVSSTPTVVVAPTTNLVGHFRADSGVTGGPFSVTSWASMVNGLDILNYDGANSPQVVQDPDANNQFVMDMTLGSLAGSRSAGFQTLFNAVFSAGSLIAVVMKPKTSASTATVLNVTDNSVVRVSNIALDNSLSNVNLNGAFPSANPVPSQPYLLAWMFGTQSVVFSPINNNNSGLRGNIYSNTPNNTPMYNWTLGAAPVYMAEILVYTSFASQADLTSLQNYLTNRYSAGNNFVLPMAFPTNSISKTN